MRPDRQTSRQFKFLSCWLGVLLLLLFAGPSVFAISVPEYRENLKKAHGFAASLVDYETRREDGEDRDERFEKEQFAGITAALPSTQKVEFEGLEIEVDNRWIQTTIDTYYSESTDFYLREQLAKSVKERIASIAAEIDSLFGPQINRSSKDETKNKLSEILKRAEFQKPEPPSESIFARIRRAIDEWFDRNLPQPKVPPGATEGVRTISYGLQIALYVILGAVIIFLIYRFGPYVLAGIRRRSKKTDADRVILGETLTADQDSSSIFDEAEALARSGNLRAAIRKGYIAFLCELSDRRVIGLAQHKTNRDYLRDVRKKQQLYQQMNGLTNRFERHWYGLDDADEKDWIEFKETYQQTLKGEL